MKLVIIGALCATAIAAILSGGSDPDFSRASAITCVLFCFALIGHALWEERRDADSDV